MKYLNRVTLIGKVVSEPLYKITKSGTPVCSITVLTTRTWQVEGEEQKIDTFHKVVMWDKIADICKEYAKIESQVYIEGHINHRKFLNSEGQEILIYEVVANYILFFNKNEKKIK